MSKAKHALITYGAPLQSPRPDFPALSLLSRQLYDITTAYGLNEALGGFAAVAESCGITEAAVERWAVTGSISTGWHLRAFGEAFLLGKTTAPEVFQMGEWCRGAHGLARLMWLAKLGKQAQEEGGANV
jgi:hypothetical protein